MILRPVSPQSPTGPPMTNRPVGLTRKSRRSAFASYMSAGRIGRTTVSHRSSRICWRVTRVGVLRGDQQLLDRRRPAVDVAHRDLRLAVRAQVLERAVVTHLRELLGEQVRERDRQRHERLRLVRRVAEHHPLVAGARDVELVLVGGVGLRLIRVVDALRDVRRLLVDRVEHRARVRREPEVGVDVADLADRLASDLLDVDERLGRDLARDHDQAGVHERLARHAAGRVVTHHCVQHAVGDLVGHLVGVSFRHRLGGEQVLVLSEVGHRREAIGPRRASARARERRGCAPAPTM